MTNEHCSSDEAQLQAATSSDLQREGGRDRLYSYIVPSWAKLLLGGCIIIINIISRKIVIRLIRALCMQALWT